MEMETVQTTVLSTRSQRLAAWSWGRHFTDKEAEAPGTCHVPAYFVKSLLQSPSCACVPILRIRQGFSALALLTFWGQIIICGEGNPHHPPTSPVAQTVKRLPTMRETWVRSLGWEDPLEEEMATHSSILAWRIPWATVHGVTKSRTRLSDFTFFFQPPSSPNCEATGVPRRCQMSQGSKIAPSWEPGHCGAVTWKLLLEPGFPADVEWGPQCLWVSAAPQFSGWWQWRVRTLGFEKVYLVAWYIPFWKKC